MGILTKILRRWLWLCVALTLLIWNHCVFSEEGRERDYHQKNFTSFLSYSQDLEKDSEKENLISKPQLILHARLTNSNENITKGLVWRVYTPILGIDNKLPLAKIYEGGSARFDLDPGSYLVHVSFGHVSAMRHVTLESGQKLVKNLILMLVVLF